MTTYLKLRCLTLLAAILACGMLAVGLAETDASKNVSKPVGKEAGEAKVTIELKSWEQTQKLIASHKGKVVVVDYWSTYCVPCLKEFPNLVEIHKKYGKDRVVCVSANCNYDGLPKEPPESFKGEVLKFLEKQGATFQNVLFTEEAEAIFEKTGAASIPVVQVYDRSGKLALQFDNDDPKRWTPDTEFNYKNHIIPLVEKLLAKE